MENNMRELLEQYGWEEIHSNNKFMRSFVKDDKRLNFYTTTYTVTIQSSNRRKKMLVYKEVLSEWDLEKIVK
jgi:hypothetical protein